MTRMKPVTLSPGFGDNRPTATLYYGQDVRESLRLLPEASVHTVCTSPPYWGLRDYGTGDAQIGLEKTPDEFVSALVEVFREIKRVLRPDGTLWVNLGDSYVSTPRGNKNGWEGSGLGGISSETYQATLNAGTARTMDKTKIPGLKAKDLVGIPWRVAFALQAEGWYLRQDIIWAKGSCMPESVTDRCTKAHEYVFLFAHPDSGGRYFYDAEAVKEAAVNIRKPGKKITDTRQTYGMGGGNGGLNGLLSRYHDGNAPENRNKRSVWNVNPKPYLGSHFAVWPPDLVEPMIRAGTSERGCCPTCGKPWVRATERVSKGWDGSRYGENAQKATGGAKTGGTAKSTLGSSNGKLTGEVISLGWEAGCICGAGVSPCTVLDPFSGSATTGMVALREGRNYIGIDLNPDYLPLAEARLREDPAPREVESNLDGEIDLLDLFGEGDR